MTLLPPDILSPDEFLLFTTALATAESAFPAALSSFLTAAPSPPALLLTLRPRPRFPAALHAALLPLACAPTPAAPPLHADLHFPPATCTRVRHLCAACALPLAIPPALLALAARLSAAAPPAATTAAAAAATPAPRAVAAALGPLWAHLHPFQRAAVLRVVRHLRGRALIADDMGLGKTLQALAVAHYYRIHAQPAAAAAAADTAAAAVAPPRPAPRPVLVLCPPTLRAAWARAAARWLPDVHPDGVHVVATVRQLELLLARGRRRSRDPWDAAAVLHVVIAAYDLLPRVGGLLTGGGGLRFEIVIADECHVLRNRGTRRTRAVMPVLLAARWRVLVSGTPALSRPAELYPLLEALFTEEGEDAFIGFREFAQRYCGGEEEEGGGRGTATNVEELHLLLSRVMVRRAKAEVAHSLPAKVRRHVEVEIAEGVLEPVRKMLAELADVGQQMREMEKGCERHEGLRQRQKGICTTLFHNTAFLKIPGIVTRMRQLIREGPPRQKVAVFAHHLRVLDAVETMAKRQGVQYVRLDNRVAPAERRALVERFQTDPTLRIAVLSLAVAGTGLTLTSADVVVFAELSWVPSVLAQAEDRAYRIGRVGPVHIEYIVAPGTVDDLMWASVKTKLNMLNKAVDGAKRTRREAFDVSSHSQKRIHISEAEVQAVVTDAIYAAEVGEGACDGRLGGDSGDSSDGDDNGSGQAP